MFSFSCVLLVEKLLFFLEKEDPFSAANSAWSWIAFYRLALTCHLVRKICREHFYIFMTERQRVDFLLCCFHQSILINTRFLSDVILCEGYLPFKPFNVFWENRIMSLPVKRNRKDTTNKLGCSIHRIVFPSLLEMLAANGLQISCKFHCEKRLLPKMDSSQTLQAILHACIYGWFAIARSLYSLILDKKNLRLELSFKFFKFSDLFNNAVFCALGANDEEILRFLYKLTNTFRASLRNYGRSISVFHFCIKKYFGICQVTLREHSYPHENPCSCFFAVATGNIRLVEWWFATIVPNELVPANPTFHLRLLKTCIYSIDADMFFHCAKLFHLDAEDAFEQATWGLQLNSNGERFYPPITLKNVRRKMLKAYRNRDSQEGDVWISLRRLLVMAKEITITTIVANLIGVSKLCEVGHKKYALFSLCKLLSFVPLHLPNRSLLLSTIIHECLLADKPSLKMAAWAVKELFQRHSSVSFLPHHVEFDLKRCRQLLLCLPPTLNGLKWETQVLRPIEQYLQNFSTSTPEVF